MKIFVYLQLNQNVILIGYRVLLLSDQSYLVSTVEKKNIALNNVRISILNEATKKTSLIESVKISRLIKSKKSSPREAMCYYPCPS